VLLIIVAVGCLCAAFIGWNVTSYWVASARFDDVREGMTVDEVRRLLGRPYYSLGPGVLQTMRALPPNDESSDCWRGITESILIIYKQDKVLSKTKVLVGWKQEILLPIFGRRALDW
jgi:hypothetical protein